MQRVDPTACSRDIQLTYDTGEMLVGSWYLLDSIVILPLLHSSPLPCEKLGNPYGF